MIKTYFDQTINRRSHAFFCDCCGEIINNDSGGGCVLYKKQDPPSEVRHAHNGRCFRQIEKDGYDAFTNLENHLIYLVNNSGMDLTELAERDKTGYPSI